MSSKAQSHSQQGNATSDIHSVFHVYPEHGQLWSRYSGAPELRGYDFMAPITHTKKFVQSATRSN